MEKQTRTSRKQQESNEGRRDLLDWKTYCKPSVTEVVCDRCPCRQVSKEQDKSAKQDKEHRSSVYDKGTTRISGIKIAHFFPVLGNNPLEKTSKG